MNFNNEGTIISNKEPASIFFNKFQNEDDNGGNNKKYWTNTGDEGVSPNPNNELHYEGMEKEDEKKKWTNDGNEIVQNPKNKSKINDNIEDKKAKIKEMIRNGYIPLFIQVNKFPEKCFVVTENNKVQDIIKSYEEQINSDLKDYKFFIKNKQIEIEKTIGESKIKPLNIIIGIKK